MRKLWYRVMSYLAGVVPGREPEALRAGRTLGGYRPGELVGGGGQGGAAA